MLSILCLINCHFFAYNQSTYFNNKIENIYGIHKLLINLFFVYRENTPLFTIVTKHPQILFFLYQKMSVTNAGKQHYLFLRIVNDPRLMKRNSKLRMFYIRVCTVNNCACSWWTKNIKNIAYFNVYVRHYSIHKKKCNFPFL